MLVAIPVSEHLFEVGFAPAPEGGVEVVRERQYWTGVLPLAGVRWRF